MVGRKLRLEPLRLDHAEDLWANSDPAIRNPNNMWAGHTSFDSFADNVDSLVKSRIYMPFAMVLADTGEAIGSSSYLDIRLEHKALEVGGTWIARRYQQTFVNPEAKLMMLTHAFENLGCFRVQLKTDERNIQSQKAMEKLGCTREGVLRDHLICFDGYRRSSVMYSILDSEWPDVKRRLLERLTSF